MNIDEIDEVLAPLFPRSGDSPEGYISAVDLHESMVQLIGLVERDIQRALASASAYGSYVRIVETEIQWAALQSEAAGLTLPDGCMALVKASADPTAGVDRTYAWDGERWVYLSEGGGESDGGGSSTGPAGGDLTGNYPDPQIAPGVITDADISVTAGVSQSKILNLSTDLAARLLKSGGTMTGPLVLSGSPSIAMHAVTKQYVDSLSSGGGAPSGTAGGDLTGTYPSPQIATGAIIDSDINPSANIATYKISGLDASLTSKAVAARQVIAGAGLTGGGDLSADRTFNVANSDGTLIISADDVKVAAAPKLTIGHTIALTGDVTGTSAAFDGTSNLSFATTISPGVIVDADISATAAIATSKISGLDTALTGKAPLASPTLTGTPTAPTAVADSNTTQVATTAFVIGQAATVAPSMDGTAAIGTSLKYARRDHVHPTDTTLVPKTLVDAKGDLLVGSANDAVARLGIGTDLSVLTADAASTYGMKWAPISMNANVVQVANFSDVTTPPPSGTLVILTP